MISINYDRLKVTVTRFLLLQLLLTLISFPILLAWGLPLSTLSPLGNLIFNPFITAFLLLSSLLFFLEFLHIPTMPIAWCLELTTSVWTYILPFGSRAYLCAFKKPPFFVLVGIPIIALYIAYRYARSPIRSLSYLSLLFTLLCVICMWLSYQSPHKLHPIPCNNKQITMITSAGQYTLIDPGIMGQRSSASSWVTYTLIPEIIQQFGTLTINHVIVLQPSRFIFQALIALVQKMYIKNIYLMHWNGRIPYSAWHEFKQLQEKMRIFNTQLITINKTIQLSFNDTNNIIITPLERQFTYAQATYYDTCVACTVDNETVTLYAAKHTIKCRKQL